MDFEKARFNMVEQQIRTWEVLDQRVLDLILETPREEFVPQSYRTLAFADTQLPLDDNQFMMPPREEARLIQMLGLSAHEHVLEIGTGSGYLTALLARTVRRVTSVEISEQLHNQASEKLKSAGISNVTLINDDGVNGWAKDAPYDAIAITGSVPVLETNFQHQLKPGGRLFVVVGNAPAMEALLITRVGADEWARESHFETVLPALHGAPQRDAFDI
jgi:protein-L-isoaspartate(D-aspartate) O-methyltransferase